MEWTCCRKKGIQASLWSFESLVAQLALAFPFPHKAWNHLYQPVLLF